MTKEEIYELKLQLKLKILFIYFFIITISIFIASFIGKNAILILVPIAIIIGNKLTEDSKIKLKSLRTNDASSIHSFTTVNSQNKKETNCNPNNEVTEINYCNYYRPKIYITTLNELHFYEVLLDIAKELDFILFCQVSLYSIIEPKKELDRSTKRTFLNKIDRKSIDFVLVDKKNCKIKLCIELDDYTHNKKDRIARDEFIDTLFEQLGVSLLRYPVYPVYYRETLKNRILQKIQEPINQK